MTIQDYKDKEELKLRRGYERFLDAMLHSKHWRKLWDYLQKKHFNYYLHIAYLNLGKTIKGINYNDFDIYAIGRSHLDAAWHWTKLSTVRRSIITVMQVVENFQKFPLFKFSQTTPQYYEWIRKLRPSLFSKIKTYEKKGRWALTGGMWVEPDTNLPSGESLVRQRLYGQLFYLEHFGKVAKIECLADTFGFNAQLPQILKKSGAEAFWSLKIMWNDYTEFPFANFLWRGIDGSEIFTQMYNVKLLSNIKKYRRKARIPEREGLIFDSSSTLKEIEGHLTEDYIKKCGTFFGKGDGGLGPLVEEISFMENLAKRRIVRFATVNEYFEDLKKECEEKPLPIWNDELYLEYHRGVYTSQANTKRLNRACEINLRNTEILLTILRLILEDFPYPEQKMVNYWKTLLFNQFHDILPGSSKQDIYYEQEQELEDVLQGSNQLIANSLQILLHKLRKLANQEIHKSKYGIVVNTLPWTRSGVIELDSKIMNALDLRQSELWIKEIPPLSFQLINIKKHLKDSLKEKKEQELTLEENSDIITIKNSHLSLIIQKRTGKLISVQAIKENKQKKRELLRRENAIQLKVYEEKKGEYPAWNIYSKYTQLPLSIGPPKGISIVENSKSRKAVEISYRFQNTSIDHTVSLRAKANLINFKTEIDTQDPWLLFKVRFPFNMDTKYVKGEIPYGYLKRKILPETEMEKGKWEFPAQKYVDISDKKNGVTLVNNSKYGFSTNENGLYLTLLHTPLRPQNKVYSILDLVPEEERTDYVDLGFHSIEYGLWIHEGDFEASRAWQKGYEFNYPILFETPNREIRGVSYTLKKEFKSHLLNKEDIGYSLLSISNPKIIVQVLKPPESTILERENIYSREKQDIFILRLFESSGKAQNDVKITFSENLLLKSAIEVDLLERTNEIDDYRLKIKNKRELLLNFNKFEIKTVRIQFVSTD
ncbi:MAG: alpha-mannosidase [Promethearchaeia archaeon]